MNSTAKRDRLEEAIIAIGNGWVLKHWGEHKDQHLRKMLRDLEEFSRYYRNRFGETPDPFQLLDDNPTKAAAFFQFDTLRVSPEIKAAVWRILLGFEIIEVRFHYRQSKTPEFSIVLAPAWGEQNPEAYQGESQDDFRVLRHLGISFVDDKLFLNGYFAPKPPLG